MIVFQRLLFYLILIGPSIAGGLLGVVWGSLRSVRHEEGTIQRVMTVMGAAVCLGLVGFFFTCILFCFGAGRLLTAS